MLIPDQVFLGALPLLSHPRRDRPAVLVAGIMPLTISGGAVPIGGALPLQGPLGRGRNAVIKAGFLPFDEALPRLAAMASNGGYGGVNLALRHGIPLVWSGVTEDTAEVVRRVRWAGVGATTRR